MTYTNYLNTWHWLRTKTQLKQKFSSCFFCNSSFGLQVHHTRYKSKAGRSLLFHESQHDLVVLCGNCHKAWHAVNGTTPIKKRLYGLIRHFVRYNHMSLEEAYRLVVSHKDQLK